jgi:hypothetical protein
MCEASSQARKTAEKFPMTNYKSKNAGEFFCLLYFTRRARYDRILFQI